jgi:rRNA maturation endonuclease Nob1
MSSQPQPLEEIQTSSPWTKMARHILETKSEILSCREQLQDEISELYTQKGDLLDNLSEMMDIKSSLGENATSEIPVVVQTSEDCLSRLNEEVNKTSSEIQEIETRIPDLAERLVKISRDLIVFETTFSSISQRYIQYLPEFEWRCQYCFRSFTIPCLINIPGVYESFRSCCIDCVRERFQLNITPENRSSEVNFENCDEHFTTTSIPLPERNASNTYCIDEDVARQMDDYVQDYQHILQSQSVELFVCKCGRRFYDRTSLHSHKRSGPDPCQLSTRKCRCCNKFVLFDTLTAKSQAYNQTVEYDGMVICASCETKTQNTLF